MIEQQTPLPDSLPAVRPRTDPRQLSELVVHMARRQLQAQHRFTVLGWLWPLARQLAQLGVLVLVFGQVLDLGIEDYAIFVFAGLVTWGWFSSALGLATTSLVDQRHLVFAPGFPAAALPLIAVAVPLVDTLMAIPVLLVMLAFESGLHLTILLVPAWLAVLFAFTGGAALITSACNVYIRDVQNIVTVGLMLLFYLTPIFYGLKNVPDEFLWLLHVNPLTAYVNGMRALLLDGALPAARDAAIGVGAAVVLAALGMLVFGRLQRDFVDEL